jgi:hypothetical protein
VNNEGKGSKVDGGDDRKERGTEKTRGKGEEIGAVWGFVKDAKTLQPIPKVDIYAGEQWHTQTDAEGFYAFKLLPPGSILICANGTARHYSSEARRVEVRAGATTWLNFTLEELPPPVSLNLQEGEVNVPLDVTIIAAFERPINVSSVNENSFFLRNAESIIVPSYIVHSSDKTIFQLVPYQKLTPNTTYIFTLTTDIRWEEAAEPAAAQPLWRNFSWSFTTARVVAAVDWCALTGWVKDNMGNPVENAIVRVDGKVTYSDREGWYKLEFQLEKEAPTAVCVVEVSREGYYVFRARVMLARGNIEYNITLQQKGTEGDLNVLRGRVVEAAGKPLEGVKLTLYGYSMAGEAVNFTTFTNSTGSYFFSGVPLGSYNLSLARYDYKACILEITVGAGENILNVTLSRKEEVVAWKRITYYLIPFTAVSLAVMVFFYLRLSRRLKFQKKVKVRRKMCRKRVREDHEENE